MLSDKSIPGPYVSYYKERPLFFYVLSSILAFCGFLLPLVRCYITTHKRSERPTSTTLLSYLLPIIQSHMPVKLYEEKERLRSKQLWPMSCLGLYSLSIQHKKVLWWGEGARASGAFTFLLLGPSFNAYFIRFRCVYYIYVMAVYNMAACACLYEQKKVAMRGGKMKIKED